MTIRPVGMTLERALEIATATLPEPVDPNVTRNAVIELVREGLQDSEIATQLGMIRSGVARIRKQAGLISNFTAGRADGKCKHGHPRIEANTYIDPRGNRRCRPCNTRTARSATTTTNRKQHA